MNNKNPLYFKTVRFIAFYVIKTITWTIHFIELHFKSYTTKDFQSDKSQNYIARALNIITYELIRKSNMPQHKGRAMNFISYYITYEMLEKCEPACWNVSSNETLIHLTMDS